MVLCRILFFVLVCFLLFQAVSSCSLTIYPCSPVLPSWDLNFLQYIPLKFQFTPKIRAKSAAGSQPSLCLKLKRGANLKVKTKNAFGLKFKVKVTFRIEILVYLDVQPRRLIYMKEVYSAAMIWLFGEKRISVPLWLGGLKLKGGEKLSLSFKLL
ncbi:hypothetical protein DL98DRAFT_534031 [Cadophora sp. DSE1049]|nr:hypothetical protein DL98DRAFT_534031 [Cadophora sp. DSE1049]